MSDENPNIFGCLTIIGGLVLLWLLATFIRQCQCAVLCISDPEPPYFSTDDGFYHRKNCPYMTEDNYVGDEYESMEAAETDGLESCPNCLGDIY